MMNTQKSNQKIRKSKKACTMLLSKRIYISRDEHGRSLFLSEEKPELINGAWLSDLTSEDKMTVVTPSITKLLGVDNFDIQPMQIAEIDLSVLVKRYDAQGKLIVL